MRLGFLFALVFLLPTVAAHNTADGTTAYNQPISNACGVEIEASVSPDFRELPCVPPHTDTDRWGKGHVTGTNGVLYSGVNAANGAGVAGRYVANSGYLAEVTGSETREQVSVDNVNLLPAQLFGIITTSCDAEISPSPSLPYPNAGDEVHVLNNPRLANWIGLNPSVPDGTWDDGGIAGACHVPNDYFAPYNDPGCPSGDYAMAEDAVLGESVEIGAGCDMLTTVGAGSGGPNEVAAATCTAYFLQHGFSIKGDTLYDISVDALGVDYCLAYLADYLGYDAACAINASLFSSNHGSAVGCLASTAQCSMPAPNNCAAPSYSNYLTDGAACTIHDLPFNSLGLPSLAAVGCLISVANCFGGSDSCATPVLTACGSDSSTDVINFGEGGGHALPTSNGEDGVMYPYRPIDSISQWCSNSVGSAQVYTVLGVRAEVPALTVPIVINSNGPSVTGGVPTGTTDGVGVSLSVPTIGWIDEVASAPAAGTSGCTSAEVYICTYNEPGCYWTYTWNPVTAPPWTTIQKNQSPGGFCPASPPGP